MDLGWIVAVLAALCVVIFAATTPWLAQGPRTLVALAFKTLCHERPDRSFAISGVPFAVCHRCFGIYTGIAVGLLLRPVVFRLRHWLRKNAVPIVVGLALLLGLDWGLDVAGLWVNTPLTRSASGLILGLAGGAYLASALFSPRSPARYSDI